METKYELWYKEWCGIDRHQNDCKPTHDSSETIEFAEYCCNKDIPLERVVKPTLAEDVRIIYKNGKPYGIRDKGGYLFFFTQPTQYTGQDKRYQEEMGQLNILAEYILEHLSKCSL